MRRISSEMVGFQKPACARNCVAAHRPQVAPWQLFAEGKR